jgi:ABC-type multidrug transport system fused ATPase/permease subunit
MERLYKFMAIEAEERYVEYCEDWEPEEEERPLIIKEGSIAFEGLKVKYRKDLPDVIKGLDCSIRAGEKVGIVGRTGAGKTTIINTLLGVTEISAGRILIDNQSILDLPLKSLRQSITMIDQDPTLIKASFR